MPSRKRTVEIEVVADDKKARSGLKNVGDEATKTGKKFSDAAKIIGAAIAFKAVGAVKDFVGASIQEFSNLNESLNAVEVVFGDASDGILALGRDAAKSLGLSNAEFNTTAVQMSAFAKQIAGDGGDVVGVVDELTRRIADFASVMNLEVAEAARIFQSGLAGETEPLRKFGIDLSAAKVNAEGLAMGLGGTTGKLSEGEKVLARYHALMDQTAQTAGDFANTSDELANRQRILQAEFKDSQAALGEGLVPAMVAMLEVGNDLLPWVVRFADGLAEATGAIDSAEFALRRVEGQLGLTRDGARAFAEALVIVKDLAEGGLVVGMDAAEQRIGEFREEVENLTDKMDLNSQEWEGLIGHLPLMIERLGLTEEQATILADALDEGLAEATREARGAAHDFERGWKNATDATDDAAGSIDNLGGSARDLVTLLNGQEFDLTQYLDQMRAIAEIQDKVAQRGASTPPLPDTRGITRRHEGGTVPGTPGSDQLIMAQAGETVTRRSEVNGGGGVGPIILQIDGREIARVTRDELVRLQRRNGSTGLT